MIIAAPINPPMIAIALGPLITSFKTIAARMAAKMTQKVLAQKLNVKSTIIQNYEKAKGIPNQRLIQKLEKALNCKLPRKNKN